MLGPIPKIQEIGKDCQLIGMGLNNIRFKWTDEEINHLLALGFNKTAFNPVSGIGRCNICNNAIKDDTHSITCP